MLLALSGCNFTITNLTPDTVPQNPSQIYTITASFRPDSSRIERASITPRLFRPRETGRRNLSRIRQELRASLRRTRTGSRQRREKAMEIALDAPRPRPYKPR